MSWMTSLLSQAGQSGGQFFKGFAGGVGEGAGVPQLAGKFTRAEGVTGRWADVGRMLGEMQGRKVGVPASALSLISEIASRPTPEEKKKKKAPTLFEMEKKQGAGFGQADIGAD